MLSPTWCLLSQAAPWALSCGLLKRDRAIALGRFHKPNAAIGCHMPHRDAGSGTSNCFQKRTDNIGYRLYVLRITPKRSTPDPSPARFAYAHVPIVLATTRIKVVTDIPCRALPVVVPCEGDYLSKKGVTQVLGGSGNISQEHSTLPRPRHKRIPAQADKEQPHHREILLEHRTQYQAIRRARCGRR